MEILIKAGGVYCVVLVIFHLFFRKIFNWDGELIKLNRLNRALIPVLNLSLTFAFIVFAYVSFVHTEELLTTPLGRSLLLLISLFWLFRAIQQIVFFKLEHRLSWAFFVYFLTGSVLYGLPLVPYS